MSILTEIIEHKRREVAERQHRKSLTIVQACASQLTSARDFLGAMVALSDAPLRIIAECKRQSPSKGILVEGPYDPVSLACQYEKGGAAAISVLTDADYFGGNLEHLRMVSGRVSVPVLRKDFIIDEYQIHEARMYGADSFLLLAAVLDHASLQYFIEVGREYSMEPLVEVHSEAELDLALATDARIIGINNRNLKDFSVSLERGATLIKKIRKVPGRIAVCESGILSFDDIERMYRAGFSAFLIGECLARSGDPAETLTQWIAAIQARKR